MKSSSTVAETALNGIDPAVLSLPDQGHTSTKDIDQRMVQVLVVGQTPPPLVGQWIMIDKMLKGQYTDVELHHVRMAFSNEVNQIGRFSISKTLHLISLIARIWIARFRFGIDVLYYPPAGPNRIPVYRDIIILSMTRWLFKSVVFHFHAGGVSDLYPDLPRFVKPFFSFRVSRCGNGDSSHRAESRRQSITTYGPGRRDTERDRRFLSVILEATSRAWRA